MGISATATFRPSVNLSRFCEDRIRAAVRSAVEGGCALIEGPAKEYCPVDTGALQASITSTVEDLDSGVRGSVGPNMPYAAFVEFGTGERGAASPGAGAGPYGARPGMPAIPYMRPALDENRGNVLELFRQNIAEALNV